MIDDGDTIPLSALEHHEYCARQAALIHVDGLWRDNRHTVRGQAGHRRADHGSNRTERGRRVLRAVPVWSRRHGLSGRCDVVELWPDGTVVPVEYKVGTRHGRAADIQLAAQALCLEEMTGRAVPIGYVWHARHQRRQRVEIDDGLRAATLDAIAEIRHVIDSGNLPAARNDERCAQCQLRDTCMPEVLDNNRRFRNYLADRFA